MHWIDNKNIFYYFYLAKNRGDWHHPHATGDAGATADREGT